MGKKTDKKKEQRVQQEVVKTAKKAEKSTPIEEVPHGDIHTKHERLNKSFYESELERLQLELVKWQTWIKQKGFKVVMIFEGRDAAGKGGALRGTNAGVGDRVGERRRLAGRRVAAAEAVPGRAACEEPVRHNSVGPARGLRRARPRAASPGADADAEAEHGADLRARVNGTCR